MAFARQNILEALGKGHYHSCLMTCYSFDFQFFELRVMRMLRTAGIQNILVLTDGPFLEYLASTPSGREFQESSGFTIYPIYRPKGVFHPKVSLFFGAKEGMFAIGSGNLTASGMGNNDEAWGCFHVADTTASNAALFADAWSYVQQITAQAQGMAAVKMDWIRQFTPWLGSLPKPKPGTLHKLDNDLSVAFLTNANKGILQQTLALTGAQTVKRIVTVSPYYDKRGLALSQLHTAFPNAELRCVVEERYGLLPEKLAADVAKHITFHPWQKCGPQTSTLPSRLHAKLIHFATSRGEYLLLGSANVTAAGMGGGTARAINEEASILLHHQEGRYLSGLGIKPNKENAVAIESLRKPKKLLGITEEGFSDHFTTLPIGIVSAELEQQLLTLHLTKEPAANSQVTARLFTTRGEVYTSKSVKLTNPLEIKLPELPASVNRVELYDEAQVLVGRQFVQHPASQQRYCPDPNRQKLQLGFDALTQSGPDGFAALLLDMVELESDTDAPRWGGSQAAPKEDKTAKTSQKLSAEDFNRQKKEELLRQQGILSSSGVHISSFLDEVGKRLLTASLAEDYRESTEQGINTDEDEGDPDTSIDVVVELQKQVALRNAREQKSIDKFLIRLLDAQEARLASVATATKPQAIQLSPLTLRDFSVFNIALHVALRYIGRSYSQEEKGVQKTFFFMHKTGEVNEYNSLKGFCAVFIGNFLMQCTAGVEQYADTLPLLHTRLVAVRQSCFEKCLFLVLNAPWKESEVETRDLLLANMLHYLRPEAWSLKELPKHLATCFEELSAQVLFSHDQGGKHLYEALPVLTPRLRALEANLARPAKERRFHSAKATQVGDWLFNNRLGICAIAYHYKGVDSFTLTLVRPGLQGVQDDLWGLYRYTLPPDGKLLMF
jgi:hypothetical protein